MPTTSCPRATSSSHRCEPTKRAARETAQVGRERVLGPSKRARRRGGQGELAARPQDAPDLGQEELHVAHVLDGLRAEHEVEGGVIEWEHSIRVELDEGSARKALPRALERDGRHVGGGEPRGVQLDGQPTVAAAHVERARHAAEPAHEPGQMRRGRARVAGHVAFMPARVHPQPSDDDSMAHFWQLFVRERWWGTGLATALHAEAVREAGVRGFTSMRLFTPAAHARARRFYGREGWTPAGEPFDDLDFGMPLVEYRRAISISV